MDWDNLYSNFKKFANRTADKLNRTADIATLQVKLSMADKKLEEAYAALGHVSYEHFTGDDDRSEQIAKAVSAVNDALIEKKAVEHELNEARRRDEEARAAAEAERAAREADAAEAAKRAEATSRPRPVSAQTATPARPKAPVAPTPVTDISDGADALEIAIEEE